MKAKIQSLDNIIKKKYQIIKKIDNPLFYSFQWLFPAGSNYEKLIKNQIFTENNIYFFSILGCKIKLYFFIIKSFIKFFFVLILKKKQIKIRKSKIFFFHI